MAGSPDPINNLEITKVGAYVVGGPRYNFYNGDPDEADEFISRSLPYFFINCGVVKLEVDGYRATHQILVPVFSKTNKYYICGGESNTAARKLITCWS